MMLVRLFSLRRFVLVAGLFLFLGLAGMTQVAEASTGPQAQNQAMMAKVNAYQGSYYMVMRGDTLGSIARKFSTTISAIAGANGISNPDLIYPGMRLYIPAPPGKITCTAVYRIKPGDTLAKIAARYGVLYGPLAAVNGISNPDLIYAGQSICIPDIYR